MDQMNRHRHTTYALASGILSCREAVRECSTKAARLTVFAALIGTALSPSASAQWVQTNGPDGGIFRCFAAAGTNLYAGADGGNVFVSTNGGASWTAVNTGLPNTAVFALAVSGTNLFAGTLSGVFLSTNGGTSWTSANGDLTNTSVYALAVSGTNLVAGTFGGGVFRSTDNGTSWSQSGLTDTTVDAFAVSGSNLVAGTSSGVFLSTDNGTSWSQSGLTGASVNALAVSGANLLAGLNGNGIFLSTNNGISWTAINTGLTNTTVTALAVSGVNLFAGTVGGVFLSTNGGTSWTAASGGLTNPFVLGLTASGMNLVAGTAGGLFHSTDNGTSWTEVNSGFTNTYVNALAVSGVDLFAGTTGGGVFLSTDNGTSWTAANTGLLGYDRWVQAFAVSGANLFAGTSGRGVLLSTNGGTSWTAANGGLMGNVALALVVTGTSLFAGTPAGVFRSTDNGASWTTASSGLTNTYVNALVLSGTSLFAGTRAGVFRSTDNGTSWTSASGLVTSTLVSALAVSGTNVFAGTSGGVFRSTDNGASWSQTGVNPPSANALAVSGSKLFAGNYGGVYLSADSGASWTAVNTGMSNAIVFAFAVSGTNLFAGTQGRAVWRRPLAEFVVPAPFVITSPASSITTTGATLNGTVNPNGSSTNYDFQYGPTTLYGTTTTVQNAGSGSTAVGVNASVGGLTPNTLYHFRLVGSNAGGTAYGNDTTFTTLTPATPPVVMTSGASSITTTGATLNGTINPNGSITTYDFQYGTTPMYGATTTVQNAGSGSMAVGVNSSISSLTPNTLYHYRLVGTNGGGTTYGNDTTFTTLTPVTPPPVVTTSSASSITATGATLNGTVNPNGSITNYDFQYGPTTGYGTTTTSQNAGSGSTAVGVNSSISSLTPGTLYHYRLVGTNGGGTTNGNDTTFTTLPSAPTVNAASNFTTTSFTANWSAVSGATNYRLGVSTDNFATFVGPYRDTSVGNVTSYGVTGLKENTLYYYRVLAENATGVSGNSNVMTAVTYQTNYAVQDSVSFPAMSSLTSYQSTDYQLIGVPGNSGRDISAFLKGTHGVDWQVYWDNGKAGTPQDYYVEYQQGSQAFLCTTGRAFWLLNRGPWVLNDQVSAVVLSNDEISIPLVQGWNLITNPFERSITWTNVQSLHSGVGAITGWASGYVPAQELKPYTGYWFFNDSNYTSLLLPYSLTAPGVAKPATSPPEGWRISVISRSGKFQDATTMIGVSPNATRGLDRYKQRKPRYIASIPYLCFERKDWDARYPEFSTDIRPNVGDLEEWDILLRSESGKQVSLEFSGVEEVPATLAVYLVDEGEGRYTDLRGKATYTISSAQQLAVLKVLVGDPGRVKERAEQVVPQHFALLQNYPNPFNPTTTIPVVIPKQIMVAIEIYNIIGQRVRVLSGGEMAPGIHLLEWDGTNDLGRQVSSGVYICRLRAPGSFSASVKLVLAR